MEAVAVHNEPEEAEPDWRADHDIQQQARLATIYAAFIGLFSFGLLPLLAGNWAWLVSQAGFCGCLL